MTREERFWKRVSKGPRCWIHSGASGSHGYAQFGGGLAHRESWKIARGEIPMGAMVLHRCNNKRCVRPSHLKLGTHTDNMNDLARVGHPRRKLSRRQVQAVRRSTRTQRWLAQQYGVSQKAVFNAKRGKTYRF